MSMDKDLLALAVTHRISDMRLLAIIVYSYRGSVIAADCPERDEESLIRDGGRSSAIYWVKKFAALPMSEQQKFVTAGIAATREKKHDSTE